MNVEYHPETDSLYIRLKEGEEAVGKEVERGIVFHYDDAGSVVSMEMDSYASELAEVRTLEARGIDRVISSRIEEMASSG